MDIKKIMFSIFNIINKSYNCTYIKIFKRDEDIYYIDYTYTSDIRIFYNRLNVLKFKYKNKIMIKDNFKYYSFNNSSFIYFKQMRKFLYKNNIIYKSSEILYENIPNETSKAYLLTHTLFSNKLVFYNSNIKIYNNSQEFLLKNLSYFLIL